jgi:rhodanese-related sulfurtransferase
MLKLKKSLIRIVFLLVLIGSFLSCKNNSSTSENQNSGIISKDLNVTDFEVLIAKNQDLLLIDVRTVEEYSNGHLMNSVNIDYNKDDFKDNLEKLDKSKAIAVYCAVGGRSGKAKKILSEMGFKEVYNLDGGIKAWQNKELPIEK